MCKIQPPLHTPSSSVDFDQARYSSTISWRLVQVLHRVIGICYCISGLRQGYTPLGRCAGLQRENAIMSDLITGTHLQPENLDGKIQEALEEFGKWLKSAEFQPLTDQIHKCCDKDRKVKVDPVLKALKYHVRNLYH